MKDNDVQNPKIEKIKVPLCKKNSLRDFSKKTNDHNHHMKDKREGQRKPKRCATCKTQRTKRVNGRKLSHPQTL